MGDPEIFDRVEAIRKNDSLKKPSGLVPAIKLALIRSPTYLISQANLKDFTEFLHPFLSPLRMIVSKLDEISKYWHARYLGKIFDFLYIGFVQMFDHKVHDSQDSNCYRLVTHFRFKQQQATRIKPDNMQTWL